MELGLNVVWVEPAIYGRGVAQSRAASVSRVGGFPAVVLVDRRKAGGGVTGGSRNATRGEEAGFDGGEGRKGAPSVDGTGVEGGGLEVEGGTPSGAKEVVGRGGVTPSEDDKGAAPSGEGTGGSAPSERGIGGPFEGGAP